MGNAREAETPNPTDLYKRYSNLVPNNFRKRGFSPLKMDNRESSLKNLSDSNKFNLNGQTRKVINLVRNPQLFLMHKF